MMTRPLTGEPLALDLLNTEWEDRGQTVDALNEPGAVRSWLDSHGFTAAAGEETEAALRQVRDALRAVLAHPGGASERALNAILGRGSVRYSLHHAVPREEPEVEPEWLPAWRAAVNYLELVGSRPERIRRCANPVCTLYFLDTSRNGSRRWCSMDGCGNRTKAARHYERTRGRA